MLFPRNMAWSTRRPIKEHLIRTAAIVCYVLLKNWTMKAISRAKRICSRSVPLKRQRLSQVWIRQVKHWQYPYRKKQGLTSITWQSLPEKMWIRLRKSWQELYSRIHWRISGKQRMSIWAEMSVTSWKQQRSMQRATRNMPWMCRHSYRYSRRSWMPAKLRCVSVPHGLTRSILRILWGRSLKRRSIC